MLMGREVRGARKGEILRKIIVLNQHEKYARTFNIKRSYDTDKGYIVKLNYNVIK